MGNGPQQDKSKGVTPTGEGVVGPARVEALQAIEAILSDPGLQISASSEIPESVDLEALCTGSAPSDGERLKGLSAMCLTALTADGYRVSMQAGVRVGPVSKVMKVVCFSLASEAGAYDVERIGLGNVVGGYPELAEWRLEELLRNPEVNNKLTRLAISAMIGINLERAKEYALSLKGNYFGSPNIQGLCEYALNLKEPLPRETFTPTLSPQEQDDVKRLYSLGRRAIFDTDQATALAAIDQLAKEPVEFGVPLLVAATRYENEACQQAARAHIRNLAPDIAILLPAKFDDYSPRIAHFK